MTDCSCDDSCSCSSSSSSSWNHPHDARVTGGDERKSSRYPIILVFLATVAGHVDEPSNNARESRSGLSDNDPGSAVPIRVELDQQ